MVFIESWWRCRRCGKDLQVFISFLCLHHSRKFIYYLQMLIIVRTIKQLPGFKSAILVLLFGYSIKSFPQSSLLNTNYSVSRLTPDDGLSQGSNYFRLKIKTELKIKKHQKNNFFIKLNYNKGFYFKMVIKIN